MPLCDLEDKASSALRGIRFNGGSPWKSHALPLGTPLPGGVPAVPETLEFAAFLRANASDRAKELQHLSCTVCSHLNFASARELEPAHKTARQSLPTNAQPTRPRHYSFDYASESSNSIDDFASKIQAMVKKVGLSWLSVMVPRSAYLNLTLRWRALFNSWRSMPPRRKGLPSRDFIHLSSM